MLKEELEKKYKEINPPLAEFREQEHKRVRAGMDIKKAQAKRRAALKIYYKNSRTDCR